MSNTNIIFLIWDACRRSELLDVDGSFTDIAEDNITCTQAVAPSAWSLPSHVSFLTGDHPSNHGVCTEQAGPIPELDVLTALNKDSYRTYGISSNAYFSPEFDFDSQFDEFEYTIETWKDSGLSVSDFIQQADEKSLRGLRRYLFMLSKAAQGNKPMANMATLLLEGINLATRGTPIHPALETSNGYQYSATRNTRVIEDILADHRDGQQPFMICANYMDTHFPYYPRESFSLLDELRNYRHFHELNEKTGHQFRYLENIAAGSIEEDDVLPIRSLYEKEVQTLDDHLERITTLLDTYGLADDTLLIVTADHGEILGEPDELGRQRMGHPDSINDQHLQVPLLIAHPSLDGRSITQPVEARRIANILQLESVETESVIETLTSTSGAVVEQPAHKKVEVEQRYPNLPKEFLQEYLYEHFVVAYSGECKVVQSTSGMQQTWRKGELVETDEIPGEVFRRCQGHLSDLEEVEPLSEVPGESSISDSAHKQLKDLGYM